MGMIQRIKNSIVNAISELAVLTLKNEKVQDALWRNFNNYIYRDEFQGYIDRILDKYFLRDISKDVFCRAIENNRELMKILWKAANVRPSSVDMHWANIPNSIREQRMIQATIEAGKFVHEHIPHLEGLENPYETLKVALDAVTVDGLFLEFGVFSGMTITFIANHVGGGKKIHGFDSFEGLPERWGSCPKGQFDMKGLLPDVPENVTLHKGWFENTIRSFIKNTNQPVAFLHADADLYSSTKTILNELSDRIIRGTIIVFDELINYPNWRENEYLAFMEFIEKYHKKFEYIAYTDRGYSVAVKIL